MLIRLQVGLGTLLNRATDLILSADQYKNAYLGHEATTAFVLGQLGIAFVVFAASGFGRLLARATR